MGPIFINPENILKEAGLKRGAWVADFGCGAGAWTIPAAIMVGNCGKVYALDILNHMLEITGSKAQRLGLKNIKLIRTDLERFPLQEIKSASCDLVIISNILFQLKNKKNFLKNAKRVIKKSGHLLIIDWQKHSLFGPDPKLRVPLEVVEKMLRKLSLVLDKKLEAGRFHYAALFKNK